MPDIGVLAHDKMQDGTECPECRPDRKQGRRLDIEKRAYGWRNESRRRGIDEVDERELTAQKTKRNTDKKPKIRVLSKLSQWRRHSPVRAQLRTEAGGGDEAYGAWSEIRSKFIKGVRTYTQECRRMHQSEGAHAGSARSEHPMAKMDGAGELRHLASAASGVSGEEHEARKQGSGRWGMADEPSGTSGIENKTSRAKNKASEILEREWFQREVDAVTTESRRSRGARRFGGLRAH
ncbi:hypothetical protein B0H13DRAFT_1872924 [Mycena leptocephala]|nr:hypothetical protein B0H13DRAFT_1872924 [Mycena leptocephala]